MVKVVGKPYIAKIGSPPDVDSDFPEYVRDAVYHYAAKEWGRKNVAHVDTQGMYKARQAIDDAGRVYGIPAVERQRVKDMIPDNPSNPVTLEAAFADEEIGQQLNAVQEINDRWKKAFEAARGLEGHVKSHGVHAGAVIICDRPLDEVLPMRWNKPPKSSEYQERDLVTQWTYPECEEIGLIKYDFLGLDTLGILQDTVRMIMAAGREGPNLVELGSGDMDDEGVYREIFQTGNTIGVFQFGSPDMREYLRVLRPESFADITAATALYRPGPMDKGSHLTYARRKNGEEKAKPVHVEFKGTPLDEILGPTHQLPVYQEQAMRAARELAGFTARDADLLRKAMGKKKADVMASMKAQFLSGGADRGYSREAMDTLWEYLAAFAGYSFNYSHSVAYTINSYQCAWLKHHYPVEFMAASIRSALREGREGKTSSNDKLAILLRECERMGIRVSLPDVNTSGPFITPDWRARTIRYGLSNVASVGTADAESIIRERESGGRFSSVSDFARRMRVAGLKKGAAVALCEVGSLASVCDNRRYCLGVVRDYWESRSRADAVSELDQMGSSLMSLFGGLVEDGDSGVDGTADFGYTDRLALEYKNMNTFVSGSPLSQLNESFLTPGAFAELERDSGGDRGGRWASRSIVFGVVRSQKKKGKGGNFHIYTLSDGESSMELRTSYLIDAQVKKRDLILALRESFADSSTGGLLASLPSDDLRLLVDMRVVPEPPLMAGHAYYGRFHRRGWQGRPALGVYDELLLSGNGDYAHRAWSVRGSELQLPSSQHCPVGEGHDVYVGTVLRGARSVNMDGRRFCESMGGNLFAEALYSAMYSCAILAGGELRRRKNATIELPSAGASRATIPDPKDGTGDRVLAQSLMGDQHAARIRELDIVPVSWLMERSGVLVPESSNDALFSGFTPDSLDRGKYMRRRRGGGAQWR